MAKLKINFGEGGPQKFLLQHVEKMVFGGVIAFMLWFIYSGTSAKSLDSDLTPKKLGEKATMAQSAIGSSSWTTVAASRDPKVDIAGEVKQRTIVIEATPYMPKNPWDQPLVARMSPRGDPKIFAPENLKVTPLAGAIAIKIEKDGTTKAVDPLDSLPPVVGSRDNAPDPITVRTPRPAEKKTAKKPPRGGEDTPYPEPPGTSLPPGYPGSSGGSMMGGSRTTLNNERILGVQAQGGAVHTSARAIVINASVPFAKQWQAYQAAFSTAPGGMKIGRDVPNYLMVRVERADVTADPNADPAKLIWEPIASAKRLIKEHEEKYGAEVPEISDFDYLDFKITHRAPPFLLIDLTDALTHPDIPRAQPIDETAPPGDLVPEPPPGTEPDPADPDGLPTAPGEGPDGRVAGGPGGAMLPRGGNMRRPRVRPSADNFGPGSGYGAEAIDPATFKPTDKKQVRFVDFDVKPGRFYRYRMQLWLEDPNRPMKVEDTPEITSLDDKAKERIKKADADDTKAGRRTYWVFSPWSQPSDPVSVVQPEQYFAGATEPPGTLRIRDVYCQTKEPEANVMAVVWDESHGVHVPAEMKIGRGGVLNGIRETEVMHPILGTQHKYSGFALQTNAVLLDIDGGRPFPLQSGQDKATVERAPGETLLIDSQGRLIVSSEPDGVVDYHKYAPPKEEKAAVAKPGNTPGPADYNEFMEGPPPGYPGTGTPPRRGGK